MWRRFLDDPVPGPSSKEYWSIVMLADISGFTKLTHWLDETLKNGQARVSPGGTRMDRGALGVLPPLAT